MDTRETSLLLIGIFFVALIIWAIIVDENEWKLFKEDHHCKLISHTDGGLTTGFVVSGTLGVAIISNPDKDCYICDDSVIQCR